MNSSTNWWGRARIGAVVMAVAGLGAACSQTKGKVCTPLTTGLPFNSQCVAAAPAPAPEPAPVVEAEPAPAPPVAKKVVVKKGKIEILDKVEFETGSAELVENPNSILDEVARVLEKNPDVALVRIEGHTDSQGGAALNRRLSQKRAKTVLAYLVDKGIAKKRLVAKGYGPDKPIESNGTPEGRERNRRVEFAVLKRTE